MRKSSSPTGSSPSIRSRCRRLGDKYSVTKERARQIEEQVKEKLRKYMREHYPDFQLLVPET